jgi:hypothetical protein
MTEFTYLTYEDSKLKWKPFCLINKPSRIRREKIRRLHNYFNYYHLKPNYVKTS